MFEHSVYRDVGYIQVQDGIRLSYIIWAPKPGHRYPTVVCYGPYAESGAQFEDVRRFLENGYAYLGVNVRGTGASEGPYSYYSTWEGPDGVKAIEWAARQPWSDGRVGMVGGSYSGHTQIKVASLRPPSLRAIVPISTEGNEYRDECRVGGLFNAGLMAVWGRDIQPKHARIGREARIKGGDLQSQSPPSDEIRNCSYEEVLLHPYYDDWWRARALDAMAGHIEVPTLLIQAWQDEWTRPNGSLRLFKQITASCKRLVLQNGPHQLLKYAMIQREQIRWLDRWLKDDANGVELEPAVTVHWEVTESADASDAVPGWTTTYTTWPVPNLDWVTYYLTASGGLTTNSPTETQGTRSYLCPLGTELTGSDAQFSLLAHPLGALNYVTEPLLSDLAILGAPQLTLFFSSDSTDTDFMFSLKDIDAEGNTLFLQRSVLRASMRTIDNQSSTPDEIIHSFSKPVALIPGEVTQVRLSLAAFGHVVRKGHRLQLSVLAPCSIPSPIWAFVSTGGPSLNCLRHGSIYPSELRIPVARGEIAQRPPAKLGTLRNQPYRRAS